MLQFLICESLNQHSFSEFMWCAVSVTLNLVIFHECSVIWLCESNKPNYSIVVCIAAYSHLHWLSGCTGNKTSVSHWLLKTTPHCLIAIMKWSCILEFCCAIQWNNEHQSGEIGQSQKCQRILLDLFNTVTKGHAKTNWTMHSKFQLSNLTKNSKFNERTSNYLQKMTEKITETKPVKWTWCFPSCPIENQRK